MNQFANRLAAFAIGIALPVAAQAQALPEGDITVIVPFAPGGAVDTTNRLLTGTANELGLLENGEFVVENIANTVVGQATAARADADGSTVLAMTSSIVTAPKLSETPYKLSDFRPVGLYGLDPEVIAVPAASRFESVEQLIETAKGDGISVVTSGVGTSHHMSGIALRNRAGLKLNIINVPAFGEQVQQIAGGHVDAALWPYGEAHKQLEAGTIRILAVAAQERLATLPDAPTWSEAGLNIDEFATFRGWGVPAATGDEAVAALSAVLEKLSQDADFVNTMAESGYDMIYRDGGQMAGVIANYDTLTTEIIETAGDELTSK